MKILFYASYPTLTVGYAKVGNVISNYLATLPNDIVSEIYYFGISKFKGNHTCDNRKIHPRIKMIDVLEEELKIGSSEVYGVDIIEEWLNKIKPDVFIIYNDIVVTCRLFNSLLNFRKENKDTTKFVCYIDLVYPYEKLEQIEHMDRNSDMIITFSEYWKKNLVEMGVSENKIRILHHGITDNYLFPIEKSEARKMIDKSGEVVREDDFLILNTNRNSYRKATDITIASFIHFLKSTGMNPRVKLYLNCFLLSESGYDIVSVIKTECIKQKVSFEDIFKGNHIITSSDSPGSLPDERVNALYNASDVGINTCLGEGFGLCNVEHAFLKRPQIVPEVGAFIDIFKGKPFCKTVKPVCELSVSTNLDAHNGYISICTKESYAEALEFYFKNKYTVGSNSDNDKEGEAANAYISETFNWEKILKTELLPCILELKKSLSQFSSQ